MSNYNTFKIVKRGPVARVELLESMDGLGTEGHSERPTHDPGGGDLY